MTAVTAGHVGMSLEGVEPTVLYDIFFEAGTRLGSRYVELADRAEASGDVQSEEFWNRKHSELNQYRLGVDAHDLQEQKRCYVAWNEEIHALDALL